jgi:transposase, IS5 family
MDEQSAGFPKMKRLHSDKDNRWVVLAHLIPWDEICNLYLKHVGLSNTGSPLSPRLIIGSLIIIHICNRDDRETVDQISENMYP